MAVKNCIRWEREHQVRVGEKTGNDDVSVSVSPSKYFIIIISAIAIIMSIANSFQLLLVSPSGTHHHIWNIDAISFPFPYELSA